MRLLFSFSLEMQMQLPAELQKEDAGELKGVAEWLLNHDPKQRPVLTNYRIAPFKVAPKIVI